MNWCWRKVLTSSAAPSRDLLNSLPSSAWQPDYRPQGQVPSLAQLMSGHLQLDLELIGMLEGAIEEDAKNNMY
jgi:hypothetical protein